MYLKSLTVVPQPDLAAMEENLPPPTRPDRTGNRFRTGMEKLGERTRRLVEFGNLAHERGITETIL